jgi:hypothetical protein
MIANRSHSVKGWLLPFAVFPELSPVLLQGVAPLLDFADHLILY